MVTEPQSVTPLNRIIEMPSKDWPYNGRVKLCCVEVKGSECSFRQAFSNYGHNDTYKPQICIENIELKVYTMKTFLSMLIINTAG